MAPVNKLDRSPRDPPVAFAAKSLVGRGSVYVTNFWTWGVFPLQPPTARDRRKGKKWYAGTCLLSLSVLLQVFVKTRN
jgi:hypothetical protein